MRKHFIALLILLATLPVLASEPVTSRPRVILIGLDGFRHDYLDLAETPNLDKLVNRGVHAERMIPAFPTKTFPNFYTLVTGLYPDNHGIVANNMYDAGRDAEFSLGNRDAVEDPSWWGGEPIWVTARKAGLITASYFWVGSETKIQGMQPNYWFEYDGDVSKMARVQQVHKWLDLPPEQRPDFVTIYFSILDEVGHRFAPGSAEVKEAITEIDGVIGALVEGLEIRGLSNQVNLIFVADHGMAATSPERVIFLDDYLDLDGVHVVDWTPIAAINPKELTSDEIFSSLNQAHPKMQVFRKQDLPERFHYGENRLVPEIIALADEGWSISSHSYFSKHHEDFVGATHGYDNQLESMGAIFIAAGPAFKSGQTVPPFENIHVYPLMAHLLGLEPAPNDGSLDSVKVLLK